MFNFVLRIYGSLTEPYQHLLRHILLQSRVSEHNSMHLTIYNKVSSEPHIPITSPRHPLKRSTFNGLLNVPGVVY